MTGGDWTYTADIKQRKAILGAYRSFAVVEQFADKSAADL